MLDGLRRRRDMVRGFSGPKWQKTPEAIRIEVRSTASGPELVYSGAPTQAQLEAAAPAGYRVDWSREGRTTYGWRTVGLVPARTAYR